MGNLLCVTAFPHPGKPQKSRLYIASLLQQADVTVFRGVEPTCRLRVFLFALLLKSKTAQAPRGSPQRRRRAVALAKAWNALEIVAPGVCIFFMIAA